MKQEVIATGKTVEAAVSSGADMLGADAASVTYEVVEAPKKGFLGFGETPAKVKVIYVETPEKAALKFVQTIIADMGINADAGVESTSGGKREYLISVKGEDACALIGHHGETLDSLQYLTNLAANRREEDGVGSYARITVDIENYRAKREDTLRRLAQKMADKVLKYKKSVTLEPMNSYERRIIHSEVQNINGVSTNSIGVENNRRVVIFPENSSPRPVAPKKNDSYNGSSSGQRPALRNKIQKRARFDESLPETDEE